MSLMDKMMEGLNMMEMMPQCLSTMLPHIPKDDRIAFVLKMVTALIEKGSDGFTEEERKNFMEKVDNSIKTAL